MVELRGFGSHSLTFRDSGRAQRVVRNGCGQCEIVASGVGARRVMIGPHLQLPLMLLVPLGVLLQRSNPVNPTYRPNQRPQQPMVAPTASVQNFPPVEPAVACWSHRRICVWFCSRVPGG